MKTVNLTGTLTRTITLGFVLGGFLMPAHAQGTYERYMQDGATPTAIGTLVPTVSDTPFVTATSGDVLGTTYTSSPTPSPDVTTLTTHELKGTVTKIEGRKLTVMSGSESKDVTIPDSVAIERDTNKSASFSDLAVNDDVTVTLTSADEVTALKATSAKADSFVKLGIPLIIGALLVLGLLYALLKKGTKGAIKTTPGQVQ